MNDRVLISTSSGKVGASAITCDELLQLNGISSNINTDLNNKSGLLKIVTSMLSFEWSINNAGYHTITPTIPNVDGYKKLCCLGASTSTTKVITIMSMSHTTGVTRVYATINDTSPFTFNFTHYWIFVMI